MMQMVSQERARHALGQVKGWQGEGDSAQKELLSYVTGMGPMMLMSGFGQTCAFYLSKGGNHARVLNAVGEWLGPDHAAVFASGRLLDEIVDCDAHVYQLAQAEALEYLDWLKKFARAYLKGNDARQEGGR